MKCQSNELQNFSQFIFSIYHRLKIMKFQTGEILYIFCLYLIERRQSTGTVKNKENVGIRNRWFETQTYHLHNFWSHSSCHLSWNAKSERTVQKYTKSHSFSIFLCTVQLHRQLPKSPLLLHLLLPAPLTHQYHPPHLSPPFSALHWISIRIYHFNYSCCRCVRIHRNFIRLGNCFIVT